MKMVNNNLTDSCESFVSLCTENGYSTCYSYGHGDSVPLTSSTGEWNFLSFSKQNGSTVYIASEVDTSTPDKNYTGHYEYFDPEPTVYLPTTYPYVQHPLQCYCIDKAQATLVRISVESMLVMYGNIALSANSVIPGTSTQFTSLTMAKGMDGALGFIGTEPGSLTEITLNQGVADTLTGKVNWLKQMTLSLSWDGTTLNLLNNPFPANWCIDDIVKLPDDTWLVNVIPNQNGNEWVCCNFEGEIYTGIGLALEVSETEATEMGLSNCTDFMTKSLAVYPEKSSTNLIVFPTFSYPPLNYSFNNYHIIHQRESIPSLPVLCASQTKPVGCKYVDDVHLPVWLNLDTVSDVYSAVITVEGPHFPFLTTKNNNGYLGDIFSQNYPGVMAYGNLNADGIFLPTGEASLMFAVKDGAPTITAENLPAALSLGPCTLQPDGNWTVTLTEISTL